jgi:hypothetical protein
MGEEQRITRMERILAPSIRSIPVIRVLTLTQAHNL